MDQSIPKEDERTPGQKKVPSIVDVARRGWDVARRSAKMCERSSCGPWEELPKEMQDALAQVATEGWLQGTQEGQEWARKGSYDNAPTDPHHGGKIFEPMNNGTNQMWWMTPTHGEGDLNHGTYTIECSDGIVATLADGMKASIIVQACNSFNSLREALAGGRQAAVNLASMMREGAHDKEEIKWCKVVDNIDAALNGVSRDDNISEKDASNSQNVTELAHTSLREALANWDAEDIKILHRMIPDLDAVMTHNPVAQVYFRAGLLACRETMARFVEQGGNPEIAASIRANWWPSLGDDPGAPRQLAYEEVADEQPSGRIEHANTPPSVEALARAWHFLETREEARAALIGVTQPAKPMEIAMTDAQIKHMVDRFLSWKLPTAFNPDGGISFERIAGASGPHPFPNQPFGTNLFSADQATAMVRHMLEGLPSPPASEVDIEELIVAAYKRGFQWGVENMGDPEATAYVGKAARDYADYTMNTPSTEVGTAGGEK